MPWDELYTQPYCGRLECRKLEADIIDLAPGTTDGTEKTFSLKRKPSAALKRGSKERAVDDPKGDVSVSSLGPVEPFFSPLNSTLLGAEET